MDMGEKAEVIKLHCLYVHKRYSKYIIVYRALSLMEDCNVQSVADGQRAADGSEHIKVLR